MSKKKRQREKLPNGYVVTVEQTGPTAVSKTSGLISLFDPSGERIEMCAGFTFGEDEEGGPAAVEARKAEYRELAVLHEKREFPYDERDGFASSLELAREERDSRDYMIAMNQPEEE